MTVAELITELQRLNPRWQVLAESGSDYAEAGISIERLTERGGYYSFPSTALDKAKAEDVVIIA